jgi:DNA-damage-inducible protein J
MYLMATTMVHVRVDERVKARAAKALAAMGLSVSDAVRVMLTRVAAERALPFEVRAPNAATVAAMDEGGAARWSARPRRRARPPGRPECGGLRARPSSGAISSAKAGRHRRPSPTRSTSSEKKRKRPSSLTAL